MIIICGAMGRLCPGDSSFQAVGVLVGCVQSRELAVRVSPFEVYRAGKLQ